MVRQEERIRNNWVRNISTRLRENPPRQGSLSKDITFFFLEPQYGRRWKVSVYCIIFGHLARQHVAVVLLTKLLLFAAVKATPDATRADMRRLNADVQEAIDARLPRRQGAPEASCDAAFPMRMRDNSTAVEERLRAMPGALGW